MPNVDFQKYTEKQEDPGVVTFDWIKGRYIEYKEEEEELPDIQVSRIKEYIRMKKSNKENEKMNWNEDYEKQLNHAEYMAKEMGIDLEGV